MQPNTPAAQDIDYEEERLAHLDSVRGNVPTECAVFMVGDEYLTAGHGWAEVPEGFFGLPVPPGFTLRRVLRF